MEKLFWSPSSQWGNIGAVPGYIEAEFCNRLVDIAQREVARYDVPQDRNNPHETYAQHAKKAQAFGATKVICVHTNANNKTARGMNIGCYNSSDASRASTVFARTMFDTLKVLSPSGKASFVTYSFHEITVAGSPPVAYCELFFHDNLEDCTWGVAYIEELGVGLAKGYLKSIGITYAPVIIPPVVIPPVVDAPASPSATSTGVSVGGTYRITTLGYSGSDGTGTEVQVASIPAKCLKIAEGTKYPYGMCYNGDGFVDAWFPVSAIK